MKSVFKFICCGAVDDGKSSLIGQLLLLSGNVKKDQLADALKASKKNGSEKLEPAMLLDGLLSEREQQITIDVAHRYFDYADIRFHILDCPGHEQYTQNMAIAAAQSHTAVAVIDCQKGISEQTKRHLDICALFRIRRVCVCLTKCDLISDENGKPNEEKLNRQITAVRDFLKNYQFDYQILPVSAVTGFNVNALLQFLVQSAQKAQAQKETAFVMHMRASKMYNGSRYYYGSTTIDPKPGLKCRIYPQNLPATITQTPTHGVVQLAEQIDVGSGDCLADIPVFVANKMHHRTIWFSNPTPQMLFKHGTRVARVVSYEENTLELDKEIIFNNIDDFKQNAFGIFIDALSKRTIGCCVFENNTFKQTDSYRQPSVLHSCVLDKNHFIKILNEPDKQKAINELTDMLLKQGILLTLQ